MFTTNSFILAKFLLNFNFYLLLLSCIFSSLIFYGSKFFNIQNFYKNSSSMSLIKYALLTSLLVSFFIHIIVIYFYCSFYYSYTNQIVYNDNIIIPSLMEFNNFSTLSFFNSFNFNLYLTIDFFGLILLLLAYIVGFISILALDTRLY